MDRVDIARQLAQAAMNRAILADLLQVQAQTCRMYLEQLARADEHIRQLELQLHEDQSIGDTVEPPPTMTDETLELPPTIDESRRERRRRRSTRPDPVDESRSRRRRRDADDDDRRDEQQPPPTIDEMIVPPPTMIGEAIEQPPTSDEMLEMPPTMIEMPLTIEPTIDEMIEQPPAIDETIEPTIDETIEPAILLPLTALPPKYGRPRTPTRRPSSWARPPSVAPPAHLLEGTSLGPPRRLRPIPLRLRPIPLAIAPVLAVTPPRPAEPKAMLRDLVRERDLALAGSSSEP